MRVKKTLLAISVSAVTLGVLTGFQDIQTTLQVTSNTRPGDPLPGLSAADLRLFEAGKEDFLEVEEPDEGLGPAFNGRSCAECHNLPAVGGTGTMLELRAGRLDNGRFTEPQGGSLIHIFSNPNHTCQPQIPANANSMTTCGHPAVWGGSDRGDSRRYNYRPAGCCRSDRRRH